MPLEWLGVDRSARREVWRSPAWEDVLRALDLLDAREATMLTLAASDETYLTVATGGRGLYVAGAALSAGRFAALVDPARAGGKVAAVLARAPSEVASEMAVDRATVERAARRFYLSATLDPALSWAWSER